MSPFDHRPISNPDRVTAQQEADRLRMLRRELTSEELQAVLLLTPEQRSRFEEWSRTRLAALAQQFDVDTTASRKRVSWAMRIASTLGALALCASVVLLFTRYWGYLNTPVQLAIVFLAPLVLLAGAEFAAQRETTHYYTGLLALVALASFILNLAVVGGIFNIHSTERALLAWGLFAILLAYRYSFRLMLAAGILFLMSYGAAAFTARMGYDWLDFYGRPEHFLALSLLVFAIPLFVRHSGHSDFPSVYRLVGAVIFFIAVLSLAEWGAPSYLPWKTADIERFYEAAGLFLSAGAICWGIVRNWNGVVKTGATFFVIFLFTRLYHWWWDWMPRYLFFAAIGAMGIALVWGFKRVRAKMSRLEDEAAV
ncbi:MAG TPA: DUF2157 domain-containing protein [Bryobacteraceae bacterium]|nr:DUF2157 domain-containing protein [Bryobacteraceae bacterium]